MKKRCFFLLIVLLLSASYSAEKVYKFSRKSIPQEIESNEKNYQTGNPLAVPDSSQVENNLTPKNALLFNNNSLDLQPEIILAQAPGLKLDMGLPYESALSVTGRKLIGLKFSAKKRFDREKNKKIWETSYEPKQELQVRIKGQVGERVTVNVDYDDTKPDKRDISVVYKGEPGEAVQEIAFGDLDLSLPQTEFVGYRKQVFGIRGQAQYKNLRFMAIGSQTKGTSESKLFTGNTTLEKKEVRDTDYTHRKYYKLVFPNTTLRSEAEKIYLDDRNSSNDTINTSSVTVEEFGVSTRTYTGNFDLLVRGEDYLVDYARGIVIFRKIIQSNYVIAIDYQKTDGSWLSEDTNKIKILKDETETVNADAELKNYYNLGRVKIVRDNGKGNFVFKVLDLNRSTVTAIAETGKNVAYPDNVEVDFENGVFRFLEERPFPNTTYTSIPTSRYIIYLEYHYRVKQFLLRPNIVIGSERITLDGKVLQRDKDYFLDYDSGWLTFYQEEGIKEDSKIEATYEYAPFAGFTTGETLLGARTEFSPFRNFFLGSTVISNFVLKPERVPEIRTTPTSTFLWETDAQITNIKIPLVPLRMSSLSAEYVQSVRNPNVFGKSLVDSMEGVKLVDSATADKDYWLVASRSGLKIPVVFTLSNENVSLKTINPDLPAEKKDEQEQVLTVEYDLSSTTETAIIQPLSKIGMDFSKKLFLETQIYATTNTQLTIEYGSFNEDADNDGVLDSEDKNGDGILNKDEDVGWIYNYPDAVTIGAGNGLLDSEDLDGDGRLDTIDEAAGTYSLLLTGGSWISTTVPLNMSDPSRWKQVKQVRITIKGETLGKEKIKIATLNLVSNKWEKYLTQGATVSVRGINNEDNPDQYVALYREQKNIYEDLYPDWDSRSWRREQALSIDYTLAPGATGAAYSPFSKAQDYSKYWQLKFFLCAKSLNSPVTFFFQLGTESDYYEYQKVITSTGNWTLENINFNVFKDMLEKKETQRMVNNSLYQLKGSPKRNNIAQIKVGVYNPLASINQGEIWINEIFLDDVQKDVGEAKKIGADFEIPGWMSFGGKYKQIGSKFQPLTPVITGQEILERNAYLNFVRIRFLPLSFSFSRRDTETPPQSVLENPWLTDLEVDKVSALNASAGLTFGLGRWPRIGFNYTESLTDYLKKQNRLDLKDAYVTNLDYTIPIPFPLLPRTVSLAYRRDEFSLWKSTFAITPEVGGKDRFFFEQYKTSKIAFQETEETTDDWSTRLNFNFWSKFIFNPTYSLKKVSEERKLPITARTKYDKALSQNVGFNANLSLLSWFNPSFNYTINSKEDLNLSSTTLKRVDRTANGEVNWNFSFRQIFPRFRLVQSLTASTNYRVEYGDSYENIPATVDIKKKLWIRRDPQYALYPQRKSLTARDTARLNSRWVPLETILLPLRISPLNTLGITANYYKTEEYSEVTGTKRRVETFQWPDFIFSLFKTERFLALERILGDSQFNLKILKKLVHTLEVSKVTTLTDSTDWRFLLLKKYSFYFDYSVTTNDDFNLISGRSNKLTKNQSLTSQVNFNLKIWRFTLRSEYKLDTEKDSYDREVRRDTTLSPILQVYANFALPAELHIPFTKKTISLANQLVFNSTLRYDRKRSGTFGASTDTYSLSTSADYTVSPNARMTFGLGTTQFYNKDDKKGDYTNFESSMQITIQF